MNNYYYLFKDPDVRHKKINSKQNNNKKNAFVIYLFEFYKINKCIPDYFNVNHFLFYF